MTGMIPYQTSKSLCNRLVWSTVISLTLCSELTAWARGFAVKGILRSASHAATPASPAEGHAIRDNPLRHIDRMRDDMPAQVARDFLSDTTPNPWAGWCRSF
jgi:hypothetical protein